jgi:L-ascorbate 6-phosphate lactonase
MKDLFLELSALKVETGRIAIAWLGQAGFLFKTPGGVIIAVDPYLSDKCEQVFGFKRLSAKVVDIATFTPDLLICTHEHLDHLDEDAVPQIMKAGKTLLMGPAKVASFARDAMIDMNCVVRIAEGETLDFKSIKVRPVYADHGELSPEALGILLEFGAIRVYIAGDTAYRPDKLPPVTAFAPHIAILPINGMYGNLNAEEAAKVSRDVKAAIAIPCHFWTFKEQGGDPEAFAKAMTEIAPDSVARFMGQGEIVILEFRT